MSQHKWIAHDTPRILGAEPNLFLRTRSCHTRINILILLQIISMKESVAKDIPSLTTFLFRVSVT